MICPLFSKGFSNLLFLRTYFVVDNPLIGQLSTCYYFIISLIHLNVMPVMKRVIMKEMLRFLVTGKISVALTARLSIIKTLNETENWSS